MKHKSLKIIAFITLGAFCFCTTSCKTDKNKTIKPLVIAFKKEGELTLRKATNDAIITTLDIEIADDDYQTQTGLMYRTSMEENQGMLFVFPEATYHSFYMKNTQIPLDIIFIDSNKSIINIQKNAKPFDETSLPSEAPAKYVLEINAGLSDQWQLKTGDTIDYTQY